MKPKVTFIRTVMGFMMWLARLALRLNYSAQTTAKRQLTSSSETHAKWRAKWNDFLRKTDFWKSDGVNGLWGFYGHHYTWHGFESFPLHIQMCIFLSVLTFFSFRALKKVEVMADRSWKGGNRAFLWHAIEDKFDYQYAFAFNPIKEPEPPKLMLMRTLQKEMWAASLKRGTWFLDPHHY
ncbi:unnamed protein product [Litomosoides sigmodontis]|uniref:Uncharacterized protein n=1 Tax=Litomosoides sigmodontis TaxID=42156 RepID=A0A3P6T183_LITSI|nr:unnamed protein product [Litomosoides sigmodontis]